MRDKIELFVSFSFLFLFAAVIIYADFPNISAVFRNCSLLVRHFECDSSLKNANIVQDFFVLSAFIVLNLAYFYPRRIYEKISQDLSRINANLDKSNVSWYEVLDETSWDELRKNIFRTISASSDRFIRATSSFYELPDTYFDELAHVICDSKMPDYRLLTAKGNDPKHPDSIRWNERFEKEMKLRISSLNKAAGDNPDGWALREHFSVKKTRYHARIDFLIVGDNLFMNVKTRNHDSRGREYIYVKDARIVSAFRQWFDTIWNNTDLSEEVSMEELRVLGYLGP